MTLIPTATLVLASCGSTGDAGSGSNNSDHMKVEDQEDSADFTSPFSQPGTLRTYPNIFSLLETKLQEFDSVAEGEQYCLEDDNIGSVFRYLDPSSPQTTLYQSCLGVSLDAKNASSSVSYFKAFQSDPNFFRQFSGFVHLSLTDSQTLKVSCFRAPENNMSEKTFSLDAPLVDLCGSVFAFKFHIDDPNNLKSASIVFAGGGPDYFEFGEFK